MRKRRAKGSSAWEQMVVQRDELLSNFDQSRRKAKGHGVQTFHGRAGEARFRDWLADFLPKRFGVTSGYIVAQGLKAGTVFPHYDVIIYDILEAPILWIEGTPDTSERGKSRAVPVEYVRSVLEAKATYSTADMKKAMDHLREMAPYYDAFDSPDEAYKRYLPRHFFCGLVFFDAKKSQLASETAKAHMIAEPRPRGFVGGLILRGEGEKPEDSAQLYAYKEMIVEKEVQEAFRYYCRWSPFGFSRFVFDLVARLNGNYTDRRLSSFHAISPPSADLEALKESS